MAIRAAISTTNMEVDFGRLHDGGAGAFGAHLTVLASISTDEMAADIAMQPDPDTDTRLGLSIPESSVYWFSSVCFYRFSSKR